MATFATIRIYDSPSNTSKYFASYVVNDGHHFNKVVPINDDMSQLLIQSDARLFVWNLLTDQRQYVNTVRPKLLQANEDGSKAMRELFSFSFTCSGIVHLLRCKTLDSPLVSFLI